MFFRRPRDYQLPIGLLIFYIFNTHTKFYDTGVEIRTDWLQIKALASDDDTDNSMAFLYRVKHTFAFTEKWNFVLKNDKLTAAPVDDYRRVPPQKIINQRSQYVQSEFASASYTCYTVNLCATGELISLWRVEA